MNINTVPDEINSLIEQYHNPLFYFVRSRVHSSTDAEDIVQEIWLRSLRVIRTGAVQNIRAYLHRVAHNLMVDHLRSSLRYSPAEESMLLAIPDTRVDTEQTLLNREELQQVEAAIQRMSERSREVFLLNRVEGMSYAKIGRKLGITRQTAHEHMTRAILFLQDDLQKDK